MSKADDLIERMERETGKRIDDNDGDNLAMAGLFGAIARAMGKTPASYRARDDVAAGIVIRHQMTPEYQRQKEAGELMASLLCAGIDPAELGGVFGKDK